MELSEFVRLVKAFDALSHTDKIKHFAWYLHTHRKCERFDQATVRGCYQAQHLEPPNLGANFGRMEASKLLLKDRQGYRLERRARDELDKKYGEHEMVIIVSELLKDRPGKVSDEAERRLLSEALICYKHQAFRAAIIMTWNLAYDHLLNWIFADAQRLADFNAAIPRRYPKKSRLVMARREDFEELKESETVEVCGTAGSSPTT
jgi:hypothetical protein